MKNLIIRIVKNKFALGAAIFTASNFIIGFLNYLFNSLAAKALGPVGYSEIAALFAYLALTSVAVQTIVTDLIRRLGEDRGHNNKRIIRWEEWIWHKIKAWKFVFIPYFALYFILPRVTNLTPASSIALLFITVATIVGSFYTGVFQGLHWFLTFAIILILSTFIKLLGPVLLIYKLGSFELLLIMLMLSAFMPIFLGRIIIRLYLGSHKIKDIAKSNQKRALHIFTNRSFIITFISLIAITLMSNIDVIFVKKFFAAREAGLYAAWSLFAKMIVYALAPIVGLALVFFSSKKHEKYHARIIYLTLILFVVGGGILYFVYQVFGHMLIALILSDKFQSIYPLLPKAAIFGTAYALILTLTNYFLSKNSSFSLLPATVIPFYAISIFLYVRNIANLINATLTFSIIISALYIAALLYYNSKLWRRLNQNTS